MSKFTVSTSWALGSFLLLQSILVIAQQQQPPQQQQQLSTPVPASGDQQRDGDRGLWPMVNVDRSENKSKVDVHVPVVFDMTNDNDPKSGKSKLDLSVLQGLVTVNRDKSRQSDGRVSGPLTVTVFGIPVYSGMATARRAPLQDTATGIKDDIEAHKREIESRLDKARADFSEKEATFSDQIFSKVRNTNEKVFKSLNDLLDRLNSLVHERANANSNPLRDLTTSAPSPAGQAAAGSGDVQSIFSRQSGEAQAKTSAPTLIPKV